MDTRNQLRLGQIRRAMTSARVDALVVTHLTNVFYLCGFTGSNGALVVPGDAAHLFTDSRYTIQAQDEATGARIHITRGPLAAAVGGFLARHKAHKRARVGFDPAHLTVAEWTRLKSAAGTRLRWKPVPGLVEELREIKDPAELSTMREAAALGSDVMAEVIQLIRPGIAEIELASEIDYRMRRKGADGAAFESIVASGARSALPHARPTAKRLQKNELVVIDLGAILRHYCSDLTRTVYLGRAPENVRRWYQAVEQAQQAALESVRAGVTAGAIDRAARSSLGRSKLASYFVHSTGHGLGIEVHETPRLGKGQKQKIRAGNVVTLEPGIYMEGVGGIRVEDDVAVHSDRAEVLTSAPRGLLEI
jgi:Xaa-Pro aminopeptidase